MANTVSKYLKNLDKETNQAGKAGEIYKVLKGTPKEKAAANKLRNERGQMFGALLQGRRYNAQGKQITNTKPKPKTTPTPKFIAPTLSQYKSSAAYRAGDLTYKQYIAAMKNTFDIKNKKK